MSLFKVRDIWSTSCGQDEVFDFNCLIISDLLGIGNEQIIVGSQSGYIRIFSPLFNNDESDTKTGYKATDLLLESQLAYPILQVSTGKFVSGSKTLHIGILHPRVLSVYSLVTVSGSADFGDQSQLYLAYEHQLKRSAYNMIIGGFGNVDGRDFICVQSLDGTLMFFEQETLTLTRNLTSFLLPSPIIYISYTDSFIFLNSNWFLECYRYQILGENPTKKLTSSWNYNLGESIYDMQTVPITNNEVAILIIAERTIYCFKENGVILFSKRIQYTPICCKLYSKGETDVSYLIATDTNELLIYEKTKLMWSAQLNFRPIIVDRINLKKISGCLVLLSEEGELQCCYLGTEPTVFVPPPLQANNSSLADIENKYSTLQHEISSYLQNSKTLSSGIKRPDVKLTIKPFQVQPGQSECRVELALVANTPVHNLHLSIRVEYPLIAESKDYFLSNLNESVEIYTTIKVDESEIPAWNLEMNVIGSYKISDTTFGSVKSSAILPIQLIITLSAPLQEGKYKLTFSVNQSVLLPTLFPEFFKDSWTETGSSEINAGFKFNKSNDNSFTVFHNKNHLRYRLEAESLLSLSIGVFLLAKKLATKKLTSMDYSIVLEGLLLEIDKNIELRNQLRENQLLLKQGSAQLRAVEKRLLTKLRDKTPSDIEPLITILNDTHKFIMETADTFETHKTELDKNGIQIGSLLKLIISLISLNGASIKEQVDTLYKTLSCTTSYTENQGWVEIAHTGLSYLLHTSLSTSIRERQKWVPPSKEFLVTTGDKLKQNLVKAFDRVAKGTKINDERAVSPILENDGDEAGSLKDESDSTPKFKFYDEKQDNTLSMDEVLELNNDDVV